jgi:hypothetical protein
LIFVLTGKNDSVSTPHDAGQLIRLGLTTAVEPGLSLLIAESLLKSMLHEIAAVRRASRLNGLVGLRLTESERRRGDELQGGADLPHQLLEPRLQRILQPRRGVGVDQFDERRNP